MGSLSQIMADNNAFEWCPIHNQCFEMIKIIMCKTSILKPIDPKVKEKIWVVCDALMLGVRAMYRQGLDW
jgi:hypothetical protein